MSSVQPLREFIRQRLTAAAEEIFSEVEKSIIQYQEEIDRQRLLDISWRPRISSQRAEFQQNHVGMEEKRLNDQLLNNLERDGRLDLEKPEPAWVKEEQDEFISLQLKMEQGESETLQRKEEELRAEQNDMFISQEGEQFVLKQETKIFMVSRSEPENRDQQGSTEEDAGWSGTQETNPGEENRGGPKDEGPKRPDAEEDLFCKICGKFFSPKCRLLKHLQTHTGEKPFVCPTCGKGFSVRWSLVNHMRTHTGEKPFVCKTCGKKFSLRSSLRIHMSVHTGERPFSCGTCGKSFFRRSALKKHTTTHEGEKPFSCKICERGFKRKGDLNVHMRAHTGKLFECELCGKRLSRHCLLTYHMRTHTGERPFSCLTCGKGFCTNGELTAHMKKHTGKA
ncbi:oocyte zinc finger protein XlCOF6.1-like isoform X5 [Cyprinodon tularosa]|uniref:oocyte zinc finger protein XlCOF6.1-like isoform X5 n=1 Tax=Cyprinodon tularosa TaxID=77115 RepID=UPI0018E233B8|nr:oocyte zinc finger protein XlCOF6.1-like isoform X5 [Cyprinodon tularosa]